MNQIRPVGLKQEEIPAPLALDQALVPGVGLDQTHQQRTTVKKRHQTMSPVIKQKAENLQLSKFVFLFYLYGCTNEYS